MIETVLFVGGSADGKRYFKDSAQDSIDIPVAGGNTYHMIETYRREVITTPWKTYPIYLIDTEPPDNLIPLLIEGYGRK